MGEDGLPYAHGQYNMSGSIDVRRARPEDVQALVAIDEYAVSVPARAEEIGAAVADGQCWCAVVGGQMLGYRIDSHGFFHRPFLDVVMVKRSARRRGVAGALIAAFLKQQDGAAFSSCNVSNLAAQRMLSAAGFRVCGYVEGLDPGDPEVIYRSSAPLEPVPS